MSPGEPSDSIPRNSLRHPLWRPRLQVVWILLAAVYVLAGDLYPSRALSSLLILAAGALIVAVFTHVLIENDYEKSRNTLLVAFGATLFVLNQSLRTFEDYLGAVFAALFAMMLGSLIWQSGKGWKRQRLKYTYFVAMCSTLISGVLGFPLTLGLKGLLDATVGRSGYYLIGAQGVGALISFAAAACLNARLLPNRIPFYRNVETLTLRQAFFGTLLGAIATATILFLLYPGRLQSLFGSLSVSYAVLAAYMATVIVPTALFLRRFHRWSREGLAPLKLTAVSLLLIGLAVGAANAGLVQTTLAPPHRAATNWIVRFLMVEGPCGLFYTGSFGLGLLVLRRIAWNLTEGATVEALEAQFEVESTKDH